MCAFLHGCLISAPGSIPKLSPAYHSSAPRFPTEQNWQAVGSLDLERSHMPMRDGELYPFKWAELRASADQPTLVIPPSTTKSVPFTKLLSSLARNRTA